MLTIAPDVDFSELAHKTEGFSGADLQALLYNAHLEVVHSAISESLNVKVTSEETPLEYVVISASEGKSAMTKEEEGALERRVSTFSVCGVYFLSTHPSFVKCSSIPLLPKVKKGNKFS